MHHSLMLPIPRPLSFIWLNCPEKDAKLIKLHGKYWQKVNLGDLLITVTHLT